MDRDQRIAIMDAISRAGDRTVLDFATFCMRTIEDEGEVTATDAEIFAATNKLSPRR